MLIDQAIKHIEETSGNFFCDIITSVMHFPYNDSSYWGDYYLEEARKFAAEAVKIVLPNLKPGLVTVFINGFTLAWNDIITATLFVQTRSKWTVNVGLKSLIGKVSIDWGQLMAGAFLTMIPSIILFIVTQKALVSGSPMGSVKG